jgi:hypothetical protein
VRHTCEAQFTDRYCEGFGIWKPPLVVVAVICIVETWNMNFKNRENILLPSTVFGHLFYATVFLVRFLGTVLSSTWDIFGWSIE